MLQNNLESKPKEVISSVFQTGGTNNFKSLEVVGNSKVTDYLKLLNYMCFITKKKTSAF